MSHQGSPRILEWVAYPFSRDLPDPWVEPRSPALQADSLPAELPGNPSLVNMDMQIKITMRRYFISTKIVKIKKQSLTSVGKDMKKLEFSYIVSKNVKSCNCCEDLFGSFSKC